MAQYITDLGIDAYGILQDTEDYAFTQDSVFLANTAKFNRSDRVLDLGTGCGIIATLALVKHGVKCAVGIEVQPRVAEMARASAIRNGIDGRFEIICGDVKDAKNLVAAESFDKVLCNPPFYAKKSEDDNVNRARELSRVESTATLGDFVKAAAYSLRFGKDASFVVKVQRLAELITLMCQNNLQPKQLTLIYPKLSKGVDTVIVRARKGARVGMECDTLIVQNEDNSYTERYKELYE